MKKGCSLLFLLSIFLNLKLQCQQQQIDSLKTAFKNAKHDTARVSALLELASCLYRSNPDTAMLLTKEAHAISLKANYKVGISECYGWYGYLNYMKGNFKDALDYYNKDLATERTKKDKSHQGILLNNMGLLFNAQGDYAKALDHFNKSLAARIETKDSSGIAGAYNNLGLAYYNKGDIEKAITNFELAYKQKLESRDKLGAATCLNNLGAICYQQGNILKSLDFYHQSLTIRSEMDDKQGVAYSLNNIGSVYEKQGEIAKGLEYYQKSLKAFESIGDKNGIADLYGNIGALYGNAGDPHCTPVGSKECMKRSEEKALEFFMKEFNIEKEIADPQGMMVSTANIGNIYNRQGKFDEALQQYETSLKIAREIDHKQGQCSGLHDLANLKFTLGKSDEALFLAQQSLKLAKELGYPSLIRNTSELLFKIYKQQNKSNLALEMYEQYVLMKDSINNTNTRKSVIKKQFQYEYEQKESAIRLEQEKQNIIHTEELKQQEIVKWSSIGIVGSALLSSLLFLNRYRLKQKNRFQQELNEKQKEQANAVLEVQEQERKRIAEDLHDSLGHLLSTAKLNLQSNPIAEKQVENSLNLLNQASEEIRNITFNLMPRTLEEGGLIPALTELATKVNNTGSVKINLHVHDMEKFILEKQSQFNIYRIVQEAVNNILKHADASEINIQLIGQNDHITIMIEDDGKGFNPDTNKKGRGLKNIVTRSLWLKGNINIDSTPGRGTTITTEIPV